MKKLFTLLLITSGWLGYGQLFINEYSASNSTGPTDVDGDRPDWIEIYNGGGSAVDLTGYYFSDKSYNPNKWQVPSAVSVPAGGHLLVFFSKKNKVVGSEIHTDFSLRQTLPETIMLADPSETIIDSITTTRTSKQNHSIARTSDGGATWGSDSSPSPGAANTTVDPMYATRPSMSLAPGVYTGAQTVTLTADAGSTIHYTLDGTTPTGASATYGSPLNLTTTTVVRAIAIDPSKPDSYVETNTYFIDALDHQMPIVSVCGDDITDFLNDVAAGSFTSNFNGHFEWFDYEGGSVSFTSEASGYYNKHGNDSWAYPQRGFDFVGKDGYGINFGIEDDVFPQKSRTEYQKVILKAAANDNFSFSGPGFACHLRDALVHTISDLGDMRMDERTSRFCVVYVDGVYWGLYDIREKVDDGDFTAYYYNQPASSYTDVNQVDFLKTWGGTWAEYGTQDQWIADRTYILTNDMSIDANYETAKTFYNWQSLIDYVVLNSYIVTSDWLNWNTGWWHGDVSEADGGDKQKWRYILWDNDASWGHYINYTGVPSTDPDADPCNPESLADPGGEGHVPILNALADNENFKYEYVVRYIDLFNGILGCPQMHANLDSFVNVMDEEMVNQCATWGGTTAGWDANIAQLHDWFDDRCAAIGAGLIDCYDLDGPYELTVDVDPVGGGTVKVNSEWVAPYPWTGTYYGGIWTIFRANANAGFTFSHWESINHTFANPDSLQDTLTTLTMNDTVIAHFIEDVVDPPDPPDPPDDPGEPTVPPSTFAGLHIPNGFSPNGDGNNDWWQFFVGYDIESFNIRIFDRWGNMVFETSENGNFWNGEYKNKIVNSGIYTYQVKYVQTDVGEQEKSGNITVIR